MGNPTPTIVIALIALFVALPGCINNGLALKDRWLPKPMAEPAPSPRTASWSLFIFNIIGAGLLFWVAYQAWPSQGQRQQDSLGQPVTPQPSVSAATLPIRAPSDAEREIPTVDKVTELIEKEADPQLERAQQFSNGWRSAIGSGSDDYLRDARSFVETLRKTNEDLRIAIHANPYCDKDICSIVIPTSVHEELATTIDKFSDVIGRLQGLANPQISRSSIGRGFLDPVIAPHLAPLQAAIAHYKGWLASTNAALAGRRQELSDIAGGKK
jgi:hypothetical protein